MRNWNHPCHVLTRNPSSFTFAYVLQQQSHEDKVHADRVAEVGTHTTRPLHLPKNDCGAYKRLVMPRDGKPSVSLASQTAINYFSLPFSNLSSTLFLLLLFILLVHSSFGQQSILAKGWIDVHLPANHPYTASTIILYSSRESTWYDETIYFKHLPALYFGASWSNRM